MEHKRPPERPTYAQLGWLALCGKRPGAPDQTGLEAGGRHLGKGFRVLGASALLGGGGALPWLVFTTLIFVTT